MCLTEGMLRGDERIGYALRKLYGTYGYSRFKMGKFEEYELYVRNKDFLVGDQMITFTDGDGTLLALKPDVTISIIKNTQEGDRGVRKVYYNEHVYRTVRGESSFREVMQTGLECIGDLDAYQISEVISLAVKSLAAISPDYMLDISHMGLVSGLMDVAGVPKEDYTVVLSAIREKNPTELALYGKEKGLSSRGAALLQLLIDIYGNIGPVLDLLEPYCQEPGAKAALEELRFIDRILKENGLSDKVQIDFSVVNDMGYYNGIVFRGFIKGLPSGSLSGGQYDKLVWKMGKHFGAIGFAITLNDLERLEEKASGYDVDILILYDENTDPLLVSRYSEEMISSGKRVLVQKEAEELSCYKTVVDLREGGGVSS